MNTLADILAIQYVGNYQADANKFERVNRFCARTDVTPADRHAASLHSSVNGMGESFDTPPTDPYFADPTNFGQP